MYCTNCSVVIGRSFDHPDRTPPRGVIGCVSTISIGELPPCSSASPFPRYLGCAATWRPDSPDGVGPTLLPDGARARTHANTSVAARAGGRFRQARTSRL